MQRLGSQDPLEVFTCSPSGPSIDTTVYENWAAADYRTYWRQRISGAIVIADEERCFKRLDALRGSARAAHQPARDAAPHVPARMHATPHAGRP